MVLKIINVNSKVYHYDKLLSTLSILIPYFSINCLGTSVVISWIIIVDINWFIIVMIDLRVVTNCTCVCM